MKKRKQTQRRAASHARKLISDADVQTLPRFVAPNARRTLSLTLVLYRSSRLFYLRHFPADQASQRRHAKLQKGN